MQPLQYRNAAKQSQYSFKHFDFYLFHHVTNVQELISLHKWWLKKYPDLNTELFIDNVIRILDNTYKETKKVLMEYMKEFDNKPIMCENKIEI